jgi:tetratricopeptide (TPR) repeat protein
MFIPKQSHAAARTTARLLTVVCLALFGIALASFCPSGHAQERFEVSFDSKLSGVTFDKPSKGVAVSQKTAIDLITQGCIEIGTLTLGSLHKDNFIKAALKKVEGYGGDTVILDKTTHNVTRYKYRCQYWLHTMMGQPYCPEWVKTDPYPATAYITSAQVFRCENDPTHYQELRAKQLAKAYKDRGTARLKVKDFDGAMADYTKSLESDSRQFEPYLYRAIAYMDKRDYDRAIADCTAAIRLDPDDARPYIVRGWAYHLKQEYGRAIADETEAIRHDSKNATAYKIRALAYEQVGDAARAAADRQQAKELGGRQ